MPSSIKMSNASHPYTWSIAEENILVFTFNNILLPDSTTNEIASQGFISFSIQQQKDLPIGTVFENKAAIYFDFNTPIITNTVRHQIGELFSRLSTSIHRPISPLNFSRFQPNPMESQAQLILPKNINFAVDFNLYNSVGQLVRTETKVAVNFIFYRNQLPNGVYFYQLTNDGGIVSLGKLVLMQE